MDDYKRKGLMHCMLFNKKDKYKKYGQGVIIEKSARISNAQCIGIGNNVTIGFSTRIEPITQWKNRKYRPNIIIGDGVNIEQCCHITCANEVIIGSGTSILPFVMITDISHDYENINIPPNQQGITVKKTIIGKMCSIGTGARIMPGVTIGKHCVIGANSVITKDVPDYSVVVGIPGKIIKQYDFDTKSWKGIIND
jgi:acetyltransferase-like isoleucine patch superfamily enzyme